MEVIKVNRIDIRRVVKRACHDLISDEKLAELLYIKIMDPLEDYLDDSEDENERNTKVVPMSYW